jgi:glycosyltransferase involved in cell wall biosynthesis
MKSTMKILSVVEATNVNAVAKLVLDFYRTASELGQSLGDFPRVSGSVVTFDRAMTGADEPNDFIAAVRTAGVELDVIPERRRFDLSVIPALKTVLEKRGPDIIVTNSVKSHFLMWRSRLWKKYPWVAFHHGYTTTDRKMRLYNRFDRFSLPKADLVVTVCAAFARELTTVARVPVEKIRAQHNSIRPAPPPAAEDVRALRERLGIANDHRVILSVGRLSKEKAHADLIEAFKQLCAAHPDLNCTLLIVGDGPERETLTTAARATGIAGRVVFTGQVREVQPFYAMADVFVLSSHSEGSPNVLLEAMAARVAVVATSVGGVPEIVQHEASALLVSPQTPASMAQAIHQILTDDGLVQRLVANAANLLISKHSPDQYARSLLRLYQVVIEARRSSDA